MTDKERSGRQQLKNALKQYDLALYDAFVPEDEVPKSSHEHQKAMEKLIKRAGNPFWKHFRTIGKRVAMIALVFLVAFGVSLTTHGEEANKVELVATYRDGLLIFRYKPENMRTAPKTLETLYMLTAIPEDYVIVRDDIREKSRYVLYENAAGENIVFHQYTLASGLGFDTRRWEFESLQIRAVDVLYVRSEDEQFLHWSECGYAFKLDVPASYTKEECIAMFESITEVMK